MRTQPPFYRKIGGLRFLRLGRLQLSFCICRAIPVEVTTHRAERVIDAGIPRIVQYQFGPF